MNLVDLILLLLTAGAVYAGIRVGFVTILFTVTGFFGTLFMLGWLLPHLLPIHDRTLLTIVNGNLILIAAIYVWLKGYDLGRYFHYELTGRQKTAEQILGAALNGCAALLLIWLGTTALARLPFAGLSNSVSDALIVQKLDRYLPPVPAVFAEFNKVINPNSPTHLVLQAQPTLSSKAQLIRTIGVDTSAGVSTVRITSFGCGGVVSGSGFVVANGEVATAAHVIAGVKRPIVKAEGRSLEGVPVYFNPNLDLAVLRVAGLSVPPLVMQPEPLQDNIIVSAVGYPNGDYDTANGVIRDRQQLFGRNIYDVGLIGRDVYEMQIDVSDGMSGGPITLSNGKVIGMLFAKSDVVDDYAYAITTASMLPSLRQAQASYRRVNTGACLAN